MKITLEFDSDNKEELDAVLAVLGASPIGKDLPATSAPDTKADDAAAKKAAADKKKADDAKKKDEEAAAAAAKKAEDEAAAAKKAEDEAAAKKAEEEAAAGGEDDDFLSDGDEQPKLDREQVRQALTDYSKIEGRPAAIAILNKHGAKSIGELAEDKFRAVYDEAQVRKK